MIYQIETVNLVWLTRYHVRPTGYGRCIIGLSPINNVIFIVKFVILFVSRLMDDRTPTLNTDNRETRHWEKDLVPEFLTLI